MLHATLIKTILCLHVLGQGASEGPLKPLVGPTRPPIKGVGKVPVGLFWSGSMKSVLRDIPGAVIVVEDTMIFMPRDSSDRRLNLGSVKLRLNGGNHFVPPICPPLPDWMNPLVVMAGPNVVQRSY